MQVELLDIGQINDEELKFAVIVSKLNGKFIYVRHKERKTWEVPGGHRELNEDIDDTAARELKEETGAVKFDIKPICDYLCNYSLQGKNDNKSYGRLYYAEIQELGELPNLEIGEVALFEQMPENLTYPQIQPILLGEVVKRMSTNIYLVRHVQSTYTSDEINRPISQKGFNDAEQVTKILIGQNIDFVLSSPYKRAIQTVEGIAKNIGTDIIIEEGFKERKIAENSVEDFDGAMTKLWTNHNFAFDGGESNAEAQRRGVQALNGVLNKYIGKNIVIGTHGNIMTLIMNYFDCACNYDFWKNLSMPDIYKLSFQNKQFIGLERII